MTSDKKFHPYDLLLNEILYGLNWNFGSNPDTFKKRHLLETAWNINVTHTDCGFALDVK